MVTHPLSIMFSRSAAEGFVCSDRIHAVGDPINRVTTSRKKKGKTRASLPIRGVRDLDREAATNFRPRKTAGFWQAPSGGVAPAYGVETALPRMPVYARRNLSGVGSLS